MSGSISGTTIAAYIGAAATAASAGYAISQGAAKAAPLAAETEVGGGLNSAARARSLLLETAGGSAGSQLGPGQVSNGKNNLFGN